MKLDLLAVGVHPDDVELGCAGTILKHISMGQKAGILHLTQGELGTRGTKMMRLREAAAAAEVLGVAAVENLKFKDGFFKNDKEHQLKLITAIRKYRPDIVLANTLDDRHPDHGRAGWLTEEACFLSGLRMIPTKVNGKTQEPWRPHVIYHYIQAYESKPDIVVDISGFFEKKMEAVRKYESQFYNPNSKEPQTFISTPEFLELVRARALQHGQSIGVKYGEGFNTRRQVGARSLADLI